MERVAVIGAGAVGDALADALRRGGLDVTVGVRSPAGPGQTAVADAISGAGTVVVAIPGAAVEAFAAEHGPALAGKVVLDASNDLSAGHGGAMHHMDAWAALAPGALVCRAFNTIGHENVAAPEFPDGVADLFWCGPEAADARAEQVIAATGLRPVKVGGPEAAGVLDGIARLWFTLAFTGRRGRRLAFRMLGGAPEA
jgi:predicted dinucleotide-binding enzyme